MSFVEVSPLCVCSQEIMNLRLQLDMMAKQAMKLVNKVPRPPACVYRATPCDSLQYVPSNALGPYLTHLPTFLALNCCCFSRCVQLTGTTVLI